jgi:hypothetical protein
VLYPGYIASEMNERIEKPTPLMATTADGVKSMVSAIVGSAAVPGFPWAPLGFVMKHAPMPIFKRLI